MRQSYHLTPGELTDILKAHFASRNKTVASVEYKVHPCKNSNWNWNDPVPHFYEAIVFVEDDAKE